MNDFLNSTRRSIAWLKQTHDAGRLEVRPPFQRNPVWTESQKSFLIDSILRGYPIPELYFQEVVSEKGEERHVVVDGQQRIRACLEFLEGRFPLDPEQATAWPDLRFDDLLPEDRKRIFAYNFIIRQLPQMADEELRVIFQRLNRNNIVLNQQELRHATYWGEFIKCVEEIAEQDWWTTSGIFTTNDVRRMLDVEFISEIVVAHLHGPQNKKANLHKWYAAYEREFSERSSIVSLFQAVLGEISSVIPALAQTRWRKKSDFYTLFLVLAAHNNCLPLSRAGRKKAGKTLTEFGKKVDAFLSRKAGASKTVKAYASAVERAASDLANRRSRAQALEKVLAKVWKR